MQEYAIRLQPKQRQLLKLIDDHSDDAYNWIAYGGARGGAKSAAIRLLSIYLSFKYPGIKILIFRKTSKNLLENHILKFYQEYPVLMEHYNKQDNIIKIRSGSKRTSYIKFGYAEREEDIQNFQGNEYDVMFIDEATHITEKMIKDLKTSNRSALLRDFKPKLVLTTNPGGKGHTFIKRIFLDKEYTEEELLYNKYYYLSAKVQDNVIWCYPALINAGYTVANYYNDWSEEQRFKFTLQNSQYAQDLASLPEYRKKAYLFGDWDSFEGQFFEKLSRDVHYIRPFEVPQDWFMQGSMDYGNTTVSHLMHRDHNGNYYFTHEWTALKLSASAKVIDYWDWINRLGYIDKSFKIICDTNMKAKNNELPEENSPIDKFKRYFSERNRYTQIKFMTVSKLSNKGKSFRKFCNDEFIDGLDYQKDKNGNYTKKNKIYIFENCNKLFKTMSELQVDENDPEDIDLNQDIDHHYDSAKYNLIAAKHNMVIEEEVNERFKADLNYRKETSVI